MYTYLLFIKKSFVRDAQAYLGEMDIPIDYFANENGWQDIEGDILLTSFSAQKKISQKCHRI